MIKKISDIYEILLPDYYITDERKEFLNSAKEDNKKYIKIIYKKGLLIAAFWNKNNVSKLGRRSN